MTSVARPRRRCTSRGCTLFAADGSSMCDDHTRAHADRRWSKSDQHKASYRTPQYRRARKAVLERDGHRCVVCGSSNRPSAHHIDHDHRNNSEANLVTLCMAPCHMRIEAEHRNGRVGPTTRAVLRYMRMIGAAS